MACPVVHKKTVWPFFDAYKYENDKNRKNRVFWHYISPDTALLIVLLIFN
jgi:hypothetical protein